MTLANLNEHTKIPFGYISANNLSSELVDQLLYGDQAIDHSYKDYLSEMADAHAEDFEASEMDSIEEYLDYIGEFYEPNEPFVEGTLGGVVYGSSWLGGALHFFIYQSPVTTDRARRSSPCVPNTGILDTLDGDYTSYDVPKEWRETV